MINLTIGGTTKRSNNGQHEVAIDWDNLPGASREFIIAYGLKQYLADGAAGAANHDELVNGVEARVAKLLSGDLTRRASGVERQDTETGRALKLARAAIRALCKVQGVPVPEKDKLGEMAAKLIESNPQYRKDAQAQLKAEAKAVESFAGDETMAALLAELAGVQDPSESEGEGD